MNSNFELLISSFIQNNIGIADHFIDHTLANNLKIELLQIQQQHLFIRAGLGDSQHISHNQNIRNDGIYWLDKSHCNRHETAYLNLMESFIKYLNISCYTGITSCEFHFSLYEKGNFYSKHYDQFQNNSDRKYSIISYLNAEWQTGDGGELLIHHNDSQQSINPTQGKTVFFKSDELLHEVLPTNKIRMSIAGWLKS